MFVKSGLPFCSYHHCPNCGHFVISQPDMSNDPQEVTRTSTGGRTVETRAASVGLTTTGANPSLRTSCCSSLSLAQVRKRTLLLITHKGGKTDHSNKSLPKVGRNKRDKIQRTMVYGMNKIPLVLPVSEPK